MKTKHTQGEWTISKKTSVGSFDIMSNENHGWGDWICSTISTGVQGMNQEEIEANAKLIAAAPNMLDALMDLENDNNSIPKPIWYKIQQAIKKATE